MIDGDLGNIEVTKEGVSTKFAMEDQLIQLQGPLSIIGRSCVIHADEDDYGKGGHPGALNCDMESIHLTLTSLIAF